jgi:hypothetical protein
VSRTWCLPSLVSPSFSLTHRDRLNACHVSHLSCSSYRPRWDLRCFVRFRGVLNQPNSCILNNSSAVLLSHVFSSTHRLPTFCRFIRHLFSATYRSRPSFCIFLRLHALGAIFIDTLSVCRMRRRLGSSPRVISAARGLSASRPSPQPKNVRDGPSIFISKLVSGNSLAASTATGRRFSRP